MEDNKSLTPQIVEEVVELKTFPTLRDKIAEAIVLFQGYEEVLEKQTAKLSEAPEVIDKDTRKKVKELLAEARSRINTFEEMRKGITRPLGALQDSARSYEKDKVSGLRQAMAALDVQVKAYDEEIRIEKEQRAKERRERIEREEAEAKAAVDFARETTAAISAITLEKYRIEPNLFAQWRSDLQGENAGPKATVAKYQKQNAKTIQDSLILLDSVEARIIEENRIAIEREKLEAQAAEQARREKELKEAEEQAVLEAEREAREKREAELRAEQAAREKQEREAQQKREAEQAEAARKAEAEALELAEKKKREEARAAKEEIRGGLASGIDKEGLEVMNITKLDPALYKIELRYREISKRLRETEKPIPGLKVKFNNGLTYEE